jgi:hypothetical protein
MRMLLRPLQSERAGVVSVMNFGENDLQHLYWLEIASEPL